MARTDRLAAYRDKRDPARTPEPTGEAAETEADGGGGAPRFVVQEHHASRLHWDLRLEREGTLASWALPRGIPPERHENRIAVRTEDHPLRYLEFHGEIPRGQYGAGTMTIWDHGTYEVHEFTDRKVEVTLHGARVSGRHGLFPIDEEANWMIHRMDPPADPTWCPMPTRVVPMLATSGSLPSGAGSGGWAYEVKWDGVRALAYAQPGRLTLQSRNLNDITDGYPEIRGLLGNLGMREALLDGEIVAFGEDGVPSFERLQSRMHARAARQVRRLTQSTPVVYAIFDLLHLDGRDLTVRSYDERRAALLELELGGPAWRVPTAHFGDGAGRALREATRVQGLEGVVAKRRDARYEPGRRSAAWVKLKHTRRQELVIGGWLPGEGRRAERIGALLMGVRDPAAPGPLHYAGRVGTGFTEATLDDLAARLAPLTVQRSPFDPPPRLPRGARFVAPELVAEIEFREWTGEGRMRAPSFKGLRDDKPAAAVVREDVDPRSPEAVFDRVTRRSDGTLLAELDGRTLKLSNWDKVLYPQTGFTKGDLIIYHARIAPTVLPHLRGRALTLKRYPNGTDAPFFYEKQAPAHRPAWVPSARVGAIDYTLCEEPATLVWLANLADIELHTPLALAQAPQRPTHAVFDLDPGEPAGVLECGEVALLLHGMFAQLGLRCVLKVSGSKGMQVLVPLGGAVTHEQVKHFARGVAQTLEQRLPDRVVSRMSRTLRPGRVLVDWSQNDPHKTTITVYSLRGTPDPSVSAPVDVQEVRDAVAAGDPAALRFAPDAVLNRVARDGDRFAMLLSTVQRLPGATGSVPGSRD